jgi:hypothetical protein
MAGRVCVSSVRACVCAAQCARHERGRVATSEHEVARAGAGDAGGGASTCVWTRSWIVGVVVGAADGRWAWAQSAGEGVATTRTVTARSWRICRAWRRAARL